MKNYLNDLNDDLKLFLGQIHPPYNVQLFEMLGVECEDGFLDPITFRVINFPVILNGKSYDFDTLDMFEFDPLTGQARDPFTNQLFKATEIMPDFALSKKIEAKLIKARENHNEPPSRNNSLTELDVKVNKAIELFLDHRINGNFNWADLNISTTELAELASQFNPKAQFLYAVCFEVGIEVSKDKRKYIKYLMHAVEQGLGIAQLSYASCCEYGSHGVPKDMVEAAKYYKLAADQGIVVSLYNYAQCLAFGLGIAPNLPLAVYYFKLSADRGYSQASYNYAKCCENGYGNNIDLVEANKYYKLSTEQALSSDQSKVARVRISNNRM